MLSFNVIILSMHLYSVTKMNELTSSDAVAQL